MAYFETGFDFPDSFSEAWEDAKKGAAALKTGAGYAQQGVQFGQQAAQTYQQAKGIFTGAGPVAGPAPVVRTPGGGTVVAPATLKPAFATGVPARGNMLGSGPLQLGMLIGGGLLAWTLLKRKKR